VNIQEFINDMNAVVAIAEQGLKTAEGLDPAIALPDEIAQAVLPIVEQLVASALTAWGNASGQPITVANVQALLPSATPLSPPSA
jgi:hypothetical protein